MSSFEKSLTGVWHGLYTYSTEPEMPESHFVCTLLDSGGLLSGTIHEDMQQYRQGAIKANAMIQGKCVGTDVNFLKVYDGTGGQSHSVFYTGVLNAETDEIDGNWHIQHWQGIFSGRFLMIRKRGRGEALTAEAFEYAR